MDFTRHEHVEFLDLELKEQTHQYIAKIQTKALTLFKNDEVFSTQYVKLENGELILKFKNERGLPRKGEHLTAVLLQDEKRSYKDWGNIDWANLRKDYQIEFTEIVCIWHSGTRGAMFSYAGFRGITLDFANKLEDKCIVVLGPKEPPYQYILNLIKLVKNISGNSEFARILDFNISNKGWEPSYLHDERKTQSILLNQLILSKEVVVQGPPGTGKTYLMAELAETLLSEGNSVLVTALTNRALIELVSKPSLKKLLAQKLIHKTNLTADERNEIPDLQNIKEIVCSPGHLSLATFHVSSDLAVKVADTPPFDYVIMDEASQAFLAMFAAIKLMGKHIVWIGDPYQLSPIVSLKTETIQKRNYHYLVEGMNTVCENLNIPSYQLTSSYRLTKRSVRYTGFFYKDSLKSTSSLDYDLTYPGLDDEIAKFFNPLGGPTLIKTKMPVGESCPELAINFIIDLVQHLVKDVDRKISISILTKLKRTVKVIQKGVANKIGAKSRILVETIERVQGLTTDITIFFIPNTMQEFSLEKALFNVATSRAKGHTLIIVDNHLLDYPYMHKQVKIFLSELNKEYSFEIVCS